MLSGESPVVGVASASPLSSHLLDIMEQNYNSNDQYLILIFTFVSLLGFYPVIYVLGVIHKRRGFDIVFTAACIIANIFYKITLAFNMSDFFIS
jgi:hypothetical protein